MAPKLKNAAALMAALFLALVPVKEGVKSLRHAALFTAAGLLAFAWRRWSRSPAVERERNSWASADIQQHSPFEWRPYLIPLALVLGVTLISALTSLAPDFSLKEFRRQILYFALVFAIFWNTGRWTGLRGVKMTAWGLALGGAVSAVAGLWGFYSGRMVEVGRATGTLESYTRSAMFFAMQLPVAWALLLDQMRRRSWRLTGLLVSIIILSLWFVLLTQTRGVWISVSIVLVAMALVGRRWKVVGAMLFAVAVVFLLSPSLRARLETFTRDWRRPHQLTSGRIEIWERGWKAIRMYPWLGVGYGSDIFQQDAVRKVIIIDNYKKQPDLHQFYIQLLAEVGLFGAAAYTLFAFILVRKTLTGLIPRLRTARRDKADMPDLKLMTLGIWGALISILIYGLIGNFYENHNAILFWALIGLAAALPVLSDSKRSS